MWIRSASIGPFRRVALAEFAFAPGANLIVGENAQGKTTVLEALAYASRGRSFRTAKDRECIPLDSREAPPFAGATVTYERSGVATEVRVAIEANRKSIWIEGRLARSLSQLMGNLATVIFTPGDLELAQGGPAERRRFVDVLLAQLEPALMAPMTAYERALADRNALLRTGADAAQLDAFEAVMAEAAATILVERSRAARALSEAAAPAIAALSGGTEDLALRHAPGVPGLEDTPRDADAWRAVLLDRWRRDRTDDTRLGSTRNGPHRDDYAIILGGVDARRFASQGQCRSAVLALRLAEIDLLSRARGEPPVLLLDDVLGELDAGRSMRFLRLAHERGVQSILTATDAAAITSALPVAATFAMREGRLVG